MNSGGGKMKDEFVDDREFLEEEEFSEEEIDEWEPEMQGFVQGWKQAFKGKKHKEEDNFDEESY